MTDKEIFEKLEAEIERLENYENENVTSSDTRFGWIHGKTFALTSIRVLLDSMQKEPIECMYSKDNYTDEDRKVLCEDCKEKCAYAIAGVISTNAQIKKEPVSEELEKEMNDFFLTMQVQDKEYINEDTFRSIARHFAAWQKQKDKEWLAENHKQIFDSGYEEGFEIGRDDMEEQMMANAVDATVHIDAGGYPYIPQMELYNYEKDIPLAKEGDKYKVILIKED